MSRRSEALYDWLHEATYAEIKHRWADYIEQAGPLGLRDAQRQLCFADRFYLLTQILHRPDADREWIYDRCREVEAQPDGCLDLWAREHYKSTIITFAGSIQEIMLDPDITIGIFSHTAPDAKKFLNQIKGELETNAELFRLFPDVLYDKPEVESPLWSVEKGIVVKRTSNAREATVEAHGVVDSQPVGSHFRLMIFDDLVTMLSVSTPDQVKKTTERYDLADSLGARDANGLKRKWHIGTRYCTVADTRITMGDWTQKRIADVRVGDVVVGWAVADGGRRRLMPAVVKNTGIHRAQQVNTYRFADGGAVTCTPDHRWWRGPHGAGAEYRPLGGAAKTVRRLLTPTSKWKSRDAAWLAGMYDGEGTFKKNMNDPSGSVVITQTMHNPDLLAELRTVLDRLGFSFSEAWHSPGGGWSDRCNFTINGGWGERYRFLAQIAPVRALPIEQSLYAALETKVIGLDTCDSSGVADVYWLETETGNYIAEGLCSQNSFADTYQQLIKRGLLTVRLHAATDNGLITGNPVFLSKEAWRIECTKPSNVVASQMLQNPAAGNEAMFKEEWLKGKFLHIRPSTLTVAIMCDPASSKKKGSDDTVMHVWGMDAARNRYLLDGYHHKMSLSERWTHLRDLHKVWSQMPGVQFCKVGYERFGSTADLEYFTERMEMEKYHFDITELSWPRESEEKSKYDRIQRLEPDFRLGKCFFAKKLPDGVSVTKEQQEVIAAGQNWRVWLPTRRRDHEGHAYGIQPKLFAEYLLYPFSPHDDGLDTASRWSDMDMRPPVIIDERQLEPEVFSDGA